jgi:hypothetical protein
MKAMALKSTRSVVLVVLALVVIGCRTRKVETDSAGWKPIFNGRTREGWQMVGPGELRLEKGELVTYGGMGMLWYSKEKFGDCRIRVIFKPTTGRDNSGVFIRIPDAPKDPWYAVNRGYEVQIENRGDEWHRTGTLYSISQAKAHISARVNEWNIMIITLEGKRTRVEVNGVLVTDFSEGDPVPPKKEDYEPERGLRPNAGYIGLQNHDEDSRVHFREVSVAPLR